MDPITLGIVSLIVLVILIGLGFPIAYTMILVGGIGIAIVNGPDLILNQLKTLAYFQFSKYSLTVVPMFILMGCLASKTGLSQSLFRAANAWFGWLRGGTAMAVIASCAGFGAVCGSSIATVSTMGRVALPELKKYKYSSALATGSVAAGGVLGILIPPSVVLTIYAIVVEANIVSMFLAAVIPGLLATFMFILVVAGYVLIIPNSGPKGSSVETKEFIDATKGVIPVIGIFLIVMGGMFFGFYNPTPAAAIGVFLVMCFGLINRKLKLAATYEAIKETVSTTGMIYLILLGAELMKIFLARVDLPQTTAAWMIELGVSPFTVLIIILLGLIVLGCLMDSLSMILLVIPFFWPMLVELNGGIYQGAENSGFGMSTEDLKIWFGILALIVVELGLITPPVGLNIFVISSLAKDVPMIETFKGVVPFFAIEMVRVVIVFSFPVLTLWLPLIVI